MSYKKWTGKLVVALLCFVASSPAWASPAPITLEANYLQYNDETGEISASGNVRLNRELTKIQSEHITGNVNSGDIFADGKVTWTEAKNTLTGEKLNYNYKTKTGEMGQSKGVYEGILVSSQATALFPEKSVISHGSITKCPAKIPDYRITADKAEVYPGEKVVLHHATFWIKNTKLFTLPKYTKSLQENANEVSMLPRIGYHSEDGFFIGQHLEYPLNKELAVVTDLDYYFNRGFEPQYGLVNRSKHTTVSLMGGSQVNDDREWSERRPELVYEHEKFRLGKLPWNVQYQLYTGRIVEEDSHTDLWRSGGSVYISHTPVKISAKTTLNFGGGYEHDWYEDHDGRSIWRANFGTNTAVNDRLNVELGFNHADVKGSTPFIYDKIDVKDELIYGFTYKLDRLWQVGVRTSYDLNRDEVHEVDYILTRNLHCFDATVIYRQKRDENRNEWKVRVGLIKW